MSSKSHSYAERASATMQYLGGVNDALQSLRIGTCVLPMASRGVNLLSRLNLQ